MEPGPTEPPTPVPALFIAAALLICTGATRITFAPAWAAYPALGFGGRRALPTLRGDAADRLVGRG